MSDRGTARRLRELPTVRGYLVVDTVAAALLAAAVMGQADALAALLSEAALRRDTVMWLLLAVGCRAAIGWWRGRHATRSARETIGLLRESALDRCATLGPIWLAGTRTGVLATMLTRGLDQVEPYLSGYLPATRTAAIVPAAVVIRLAVIDPISAAIAAVTLPLIPLFGVLVGTHTRDRTRQQWHRLSLLGGHFLDVLRGLPTLRMYGRAHLQIEEAGRLADRCRRATMASLRIAFLSALVLETLAGLAVALVAVPLGFRLLDGRIELRTALLVLLLVPEAFLALRAVGGQFHSGAEGLAVATQIFEVLDTPPTAQRHGKPLYPVGSARGTIAFEQVCLRYGPDLPWAVRDLSFTIRPGERVALTGRSGAGKSTVLALLLRFVEPTSGRITVDGTNIADLDPELWRARIGWLPQRSRLFAADVFDNILLGRAYAPALVTAAAREAGAHEFIEALPNGYRTVLGDNGFGLSAGQTQRIALARLFLRQHDLVLLDEPTARLDGATEAAVLKQIDLRTRGRTVLLVAHRPAVAALADRIIPLENPTRGGCRCESIV